MTEFGRVPYSRFQELSDFGYRIVIFPDERVSCFDESERRILARSEKRETQSGWLEECRLVRSFYEAPRLTTRLPRAGTTVKSLNRLNVSDSRSRENRPMSNETKPDYSPPGRGDAEKKRRSAGRSECGLMYRGYDIHEVAQKAKL